MAFELHRSQGFPAIAASNIVPLSPVRWSPSVGGRAVQLIAATTEEPLGMVDAAASVARGGAVTVHERGAVCKAVAIASLGVGADVGIASTNGNLGPVTAAASGTVLWRVGTALDAALADETFSVYVNPKQLSGTGP